MLFLGLGVDKNITYENNYECVKKVLEYPIHQAHEGCRKAAGALVN